MAKQKTKTPKPANLSINNLSKLFPILLFLILTILLVLLYQVIFADKFFPGIFVGDTSLTFLNRDQAQRIITVKFNQRSQDKLQFKLRGQNFTIDLSTSSADLNDQKALDEAFDFGRSQDTLTNLRDQLKALILGQILTPDVNLSLDHQFAEVAKAVNQEPKEAGLKIEGDMATTSTQIKVTEGATGRRLDKEAFLNQVKDYLIFGKTVSILPTKDVTPKTTTKQAQKAREILQDLLKDPIKLSYQNLSFTIDTPIILDLLDLSQEGQQLVDKKKLSSYLASAVAGKINQPVVEGLFNFDPASQRVTTFKAAQEGRTVDIDKTSGLIILALDNQRPKNITIPITIAEPKTKTADVNSLGIKELIGRGISNFAGSIDNRIFNIGLASSRINGVLIPPGEVFSFNDQVGDISGASGYKQAYVIKSGRTVLDDGGGVCQVSTTVFRAALNAGVPILARTAHAYRVSYYEQGFPPGLDATVFAPSVDLKFKNDTPNYILIQAYVSGLTLTVDIYGTPDGRIATISKPVILSQTPPLPDLRQDDPTLPKGTIKQVDWSAWGATVYFTRTVQRNRETLIKETFNSNYRPWQAIYLIGIKE